MDHTAGADSNGSGIDLILNRIGSDNEEFRIQSAKEIRRLTKTSSRNRRLLADAVEPLVSMLRSECVQSNEAAILAILNLAVQDESNKTRIVGAGALNPLTSFLQSPNSNLQEYATAAVLTLSASPTNKPTIISSALIPHLIQILHNGTPQAKYDAITTLSNLSTTPNGLFTILSSHAVPSLISLLKTSKKSSKTAEKCISLLESLMEFDEARTSLTEESGGVLTIVEAIEDGSSRAREHAVGALLTLCRSDRCKYREAILNEGVIPGLLELTVHGTDKARPKATELLELLRESCSRVENIVTEVANRIEREDRSGKAKRMLEEMVKVSMEQSLRHLERRASIVALK